MAPLPTVTFWPATRSMEPLAGLTVALPVEGDGAGAGKDAGFGGEITTGLERDRPMSPSEKEEPLAKVMELPASSWSRLP
jgi:hypothetical protein